MRPPLIPWFLAVLALLGSPHCTSVHAAVAAKPLTLSSPDGRLVLQFALGRFGEDQSCPYYALSFNGRSVVAPSRLGLELERGSFLTNLVMTGHQRETRDTLWQPVTGERREIRDHFHQLEVDLCQADNPQRRLRLTFRAYNQGAALRFTLPRQVGIASATIRREQTEFRFAGDHTTWVTTSAQGEYRRTTVNQLPPGTERPLLIQANESLSLVLAEARLIDYARMKLVRLEGVDHALVSRLDGQVTAPLPLTTPWRVILVAESPARLIENNSLLLNLNDPCALADTSWIRPGKIIREVTLTTDGGKACVDFAVAHGLQYVEYDAGWYGHEYDDAADATAVNVDPKRSPGPLDLHEVIRYAHERDIGIILYVNRRALEKQLDQILPLYQRWGIQGVKYGFVNVGSQEWTRWLHEAIRLAADHRLMVDVHDEYRPTGYSRTYPNLMTMEGIRGDEARPSAEQTLITLFTRMLAGPADNTVCYTDRRVAELWTHSFQLAKAVCLYSPWQFLFWYDRPAFIPDAPELEFFRNLPTTWDETRVLQGAVGEFAIIARRSGHEWFVGCLNAVHDRTFDVPLSFLDPGVLYTSRSYEHDPEVPTPTRVRVESGPVTAGGSLTIPLIANSGAAFHLVPTAPSQVQPPN